MRKFALIIDGTRYWLNRENGIFLNNVTGLGTTNNDTYTAIGKNGFYARTNQEVAQGQVVGDLTFFSSCYSAYKTFADALISASSLVLCYSPSGTEYKADVELAYLTKTELTKGIYLTAPIGFNLLSLWYMDETLTGTGSVSIAAGGQVGYGIVLTTTGTALTNPVITLSQTSPAETTAEANIIATLLSTDNIEYSTLYSDSHITGTISGTETDLTVYTGVSNEVFGHTAKAATLTVTDDNSTSPAISVTVRRYWRTV